MLSKRLFDLVLAGIAFLMFLPIFAIIMVLIKVLDPGKVFFTQTRVGQHEKPFEILKFRTMTENNKGISLSTSNDLRITKIGHYLRKWKLDELPQLINVLRGEMSLVGPRPEVVEYVLHYSEESRSKIFKLKPGITDWASIHFRNENEILAKAENVSETYIKEILPIKIRYYLEYADNFSLKTDLMILWKTVYSVVMK